MYFANGWDYWELRSKVTFDGVLKLITVNPGETILNIRTDIYSAWIRWIALRDNTKYFNAIRYVGLDVIPGGYTGDSYFLINGWKLIVDLNSVRISGILFSDDYDTAYYSANLNPLYPATVSALVNTVTNTQNVITGDLSSVIVPTSIQNADAVRVELATELSRIDVTLSSLNTGLTNTQNTMLLEMFNLLGLDPTKPLLVTDDLRTAGTIIQTIESTPTSTTVTRV